MQTKRWSDGQQVSAIGLGTWQLGADWGEVDEKDAHAVLDAALESGVTFFDTADVYGDGRSEQIIGSFLRARPDAGIFVATKAGRRMPQVHENYSLTNLRAWTDRSRRNLGLDTLPLVQLHCPPTSVYADDEVFDALGTLVDEGAIASWGVSVEKRAEAMRALERPGLASVQIILNAFRLAPFDDVVPTATERGVAIIARVPLASGLLANRYTPTTTFAADDHRTFNRNGEAFDVGETFAGVDFATGVAAAAELASFAPAGLAPAQTALAWLAQHDGVTTVIPGARTPEQARANAAAGAAAPLPAAYDAAVHRIYDRDIRAAVHERW